MKAIYLSIMLILCLSITSCGNDSGKQYDNDGNPSVTTLDTLPPSDHDVISTNADENAGDVEIVPNESSPVADNKINSHENGLEIEVDLSSYFIGLSGTAVFLDKSGNYTVYNKTASELQVSPCSTSKSYQL